MFKWEHQYQKAFEEIKNLFTDENTLQSYNPEKRLIVEILRDKILQEHNPEKKQTMETDASQWAIAACLS